MRKLLTILLAYSLIFTALAQEKQFFSIHKYQLQKFNKIGNQPPEFWQKYWEHQPRDKKLSTCQPTKIIFGWHPYWVNGLEDNYQWNLLTDLAYFGAEIDPQTGELDDTHNWENAQVITTAKNNNVRVHLTAILFSGHDEFFASAQAQQTAINQLIQAVISRKANGINLDFEAMGSDNRTQFVQFVKNLRQAMDQQDTSLILSIALMPVDWSNVYDIPELNKYVDWFIIMGYDYYWSGSDEAGPTGQLYTLNSFNYTETRSIVDYLHRGVPNSKLLLGVPYYGFKWKTASNTVPARVLDYVGVVTVKNMYNNYSNIRMNWKSRSEYSSYYNGAWYQVWVDCQPAMMYKYKVVWQTNIAGIGIWALGYDDGRSEMWQAIENCFSDCENCWLDTLWDLGGPQGEYWNNEQYSFFVNAKSITLQNIDLESGFDSLLIYQVVNGQAVLLDKISGSFGEKTFTSASNLFEITVKTDGRTTADGWSLTGTQAFFTVKPASEPSDSKLRIYPNPVRNTLHLAGAEPKGFFIISDVFGNKVKQGFYNAGINVSGLKPGVYILRYFANNKRQTLKFIKI